MDLIICDIDGTIANCSKRLHYIQDKNGKKLDKPDWKSFYDEVDKDEPIKVVVEMVNSLSENYEIVFLTGRNESCRDKTRYWLHEHNLSLNNFFPRVYNELLMRKENDRRPDTEVKPELLNEYLKDNPDDKVAFILEDRTSVVKKWRELGYTCFQVADGDF